MAVPAVGYETGGSGDRLLFHDLVAASAAASVFNVSYNAFVKVRAGGPGSEAEGMSPITV
jgi:hypothetical protein